MAKYWKVYFLNHHRFANRGCNIGPACRPQPLWQCHPTGVDSHTQLIIPDHLSTAAASLLTEVRKAYPFTSAHKHRTHVDHFNDKNKDNA